MLKQLITTIATVSVVALSATSASASPQWTHVEQDVIRQARSCDTATVRCQRNQSYARYLYQREARDEAARELRARETSRYQHRYDTSSYRGNYTPASPSKANPSFIRSVVSIFSGL